MTVEIAMWIMAAMLAPTMAWAMAVTINLLLMKRGIDDLVQMHRNPENTGFGIAPLLPLLENNTKALNELTAMTREQMIWMRANHRKN